MAVVGTRDGGESEGAGPWLIIGLGNPGVDYENTYHNVGFRVVDTLARRLGVAIRGKTGPARLESTAGYGNEIVLVQPQTYMNRSGAVLSMLYEKFGANSRILVVSDDLALPLGRIRIRERGSAGGHNGLKSIGSAVGSGDFLRVRVGIDAGRSIDDARDYVLSEVARSDRELLERSEELAADAVAYTLTEGARPAMSKYNGMDLRDSDGPGEGGGPDSGRAE